MQSSYRHTLETHLPFHIILTAEVPDIFIRKFRDDSAEMLSGERYYL